MSKRLLWILIFGLAVNASPIGSHAQTPLARDAAASLYQELLNIGRDADFPSLSGPWRLSLPEDHGAHSAARIESWGIVAHLRTEEGELVNLQFSLARLGLRSPDAALGQFDLRELYRAHIVAVMTQSGARWADERFSRGLGAAGDDGASGVIWIDDWRLSSSGKAEIDLEIFSAGEAVSLRFHEGKSPIQQAADGKVPFRGFALPRMNVEGRIGSNTVTGTAWLDRLWGDVPMPGGPIAYDRVILHLDDGFDIGLVRTRRQDGGGIATLDGVVVDGSGTVSAISDETIEMTAVKTWQSEKAGEAYPVGWRIAGAGLDLDVSPIQENQRHTFASPVWLGGVRVEGTRNGQPVSGVGSLQLSGYEE